VGIIVPMLDTHISMSSVSHVPMSVDLVSNIILQDFRLVLFVRVGIPNLRESYGHTLRDELGARGFLVVWVCGPFVAWRVDGEEEYP